jgi:hypothetical protein
MLTANASLQSFEILVEKTIHTQSLAPTLNILVKEIYTTRAVIT